MKANPMILILPCVLGLSACYQSKTKNDISGRLNVARPVQVLDKSGNTYSLDETKTYSATLHMTKKGSDFEIVLADAVADNLQTNSAKVDVLLPNPVADQLGKFQVVASASKQSFNIEGEVSEVITTSEETGNDTCIYDQVSQTVCHDYEPYPSGPAYPHPGPVPVPGPGHGGGHPGSHPGPVPVPGPGRGTRELLNSMAASVPYEVCHVELINIYGRRMFRITRESNERVATLKMLNPADQAVLATYSGSYRISSVFRNKTYTSACLP
jgi:hypothetical protein